jgi:hypothetical protein
LTKRLIDDMFKAHAFHEAVIAGASTDNLPKARSVGYGIGVAFAIFGMMVCSGMFNARAFYGAGSAGIMMRSAVGSDEGFT